MNLVTYNVVKAFNLNDYKKSVSKDSRLGTVVFLVDDQQILLGYKKTGFGKGNLLGIGGKVEEGESIEEGAVREVEEEIGVVIAKEKLKHHGVVNFYFPHVEDESWNMVVHVFVAKEWGGEPQESGEIRPEWFYRDQIPFDKMWHDAQFWLPEILNDKVIEADFLFNDSLEVVEYNLR